MSKILRVTLIGYIIFCAGQFVPAGEETNKTTKTVITADEMSYDYKRSIAIFQDNVVVDDPQVNLESDTLTVLFNSTNEIKSITAVGNVVITSEDKKATCNKAIYIAQTGEVLLSGNAVLHRASDTLEGRQITFWVNEERVLCKPGKLIIYSDKDRSSEDILKPGGGKK